MKYKFIILALVLFAANISFYIRTSELLSDSESRRMQNEIVVFAQTIIPFYLNGNLNAIYKMSRDFGYTQISHIPHNAEILFDESNGFLNFRIFSDEKFIGFSLALLDDSIIFMRKKDSSAWQKYRIFMLAFQLTLILLLLFFLFYQVLRPLNLLKDSIDELKSGVYAKKLKADSRDEMGALFRAFNEMNEKISRLLKARELITRNIAHELRTPLAKIKLAISLKEGDSLKKDLNKYIDSLNRISQNMLEFERIQEEGFSIAQDEFLSESAVFEALKDLVGEKIVLNIVKSVKIKGDLRLLSVAFKNLIENAIKYSEDGVVEIELNENGISFVNKGAKLEKDIAYYFEPFYRGDITKSGYGLGLSIVKEIIALHKMRLIYRYDCGKHIFYIKF